MIGASGLARLSAIAGGGSSANFATDIRPWLGKEAAFALMNTTSSSAGSLIVLDVRNGSGPGHSSAGPERAPSVSTTECRCLVLLFIIKATY